jgi:kynurenine formamidase
MYNLIDLTHEITPDMPVHAYDTPARLFQDRFLKTDKYNGYRLESGMHAGTHIDAPMHLLESRTFIGDLPAERFCGRGCLLDVRDREVIGLAKEYGDIVRKGDIVLLFTGHGAKWGTEAYYGDHPVMNEELAGFFAEKQISMVGMDTPAPDVYPFVIHKILFKHNVLIIENLANLSALPQKTGFEIFAFPLKIRAEASLARVIARVETS